MKRFVLAVAVLAAAAAPVSAQASSELFLPLPSWITDTGSALNPDADTSFGLRAGYHKARDADDGTWLGGVQLRIALGEVLALEGSIEVRRDEYLDGVAEVITYPVQASLLWYLMRSELSLYVLGGLGWYYSRISFDSSLPLADDETDSDIGFHLGVGVDFGLGDKTSINGDIRYIFLDPDSDNLENEDFDTIEFVIGLNFKV